MPLWEALKFLKKTCTEDPPLVVLCDAGIPIAEGLVFWFHLSWEFWFGFSLHEWPANYKHDSVHTGQVLWGKLFCWFVIGVSVLFCAPSIGSEREVDCTHFGFVMASLGCSEHTSLLLFWVTGSLQLGCLEHSLQSLSLHLPVFVICSVYPLLLSVVFPVTPFLQVGESPIIPNSSWSHLTGNLSYSRVRTCDGSYMELRCLFFIAVAFVFIFLINFNKPFTFLLMWGPPNPRVHPFNVYWRDLRRTVAFHSSRKSCTLFVKSTGLLWSK